MRLVYATAAGVDRCPDEVAVRAAVSARLGRDPFSDEATSEVRASIRRARRGLRAEVRLVGHGRRARGVRRLATRRDDCAALADAVALAISLAIDPLSGTRPAPRPADPPPAPPEAQPSTPAPAPQPAPQPAPTPAPAPTPTPPPTPRRTPSLVTDAYVGLGGALSINVVPSLAVGPSLEGGVRLGPRWSLGGELRYAGGETALVNGTVRGDLVSLTALPCVHVSFASACAVLTGGVVFGQGSGFPTDLTGVTGLFALGARARVESPRVGPVSFVGWAEVTALVGVPVLRVEASEQRWRPDAPAVSAGVGARLHFR
ncbi:MAG: hypothetical protein R3A52_09085 [Polyangiales bacterium]